MNMNWEVRSLGELISYRNEFIQIDDTTEYKRVRVQLHAKGIVLRDVVKGLELKTKNQQVCKKGDFLVAEIDAKVGGFGIVPEELEGAIVSSHYFLFDIDESKLDRKFLGFFLKTPEFQNQIVARGTTNYAAIRPQHVLEINIPLPTIEEQRRIVSILENISDGVEEAKALQEEQSQLLSKLRQAILQEAVQGKLVPQDSADEPATELLKRIKAEKLQLTREKKIKKEKPLPPISPDEVPYELPEGWVWVRLGEIAINIHYGYTVSANFSKRDYRLLRITDIQDNKVDWKNVPGCEIDEKDVEKYLLNENDILIARTGGTIGKSYLVKNLSVNAVFASYLIRVIPSKNINPNYLKIFLESSLYWKQLMEKSMGTGQPNVNGVSLSRLVIPVPPLNEQKRIVAKVDELMKLCDELEEQIRQSKEESERLRQAVLREAFEGKDVEESNNDIYNEKYG
jgi:type I restriction enzyme, S subunit